MKVIVAGGCNGWCYEHPPLASAELYDPATDTWTKLPDMPYPISSSKMEQVNGYPTIIGGVTKKSAETIKPSELAQKEEGRKTTRIFAFYFLGKWKLEGTILSNQAGITLNTHWKIPGTSEKGTIQNTDAGVYGYLSVNALASGSSVMEETFDASNDGQRWERSVDDELGYFTLKNLKSQKYLTANNPQNTLTIEGTYI